MLAWLFLPAALAAHYVVRDGDTLSSIADALGDPALVGELRAQNRLSDEEEPLPGTVLVLPDLEGTVGSQAAHVATIRGTGTVRGLDGSTSPLEVGMSLAPGEVACTGAESFSRIRLARGLDSYDHDDVSLLPETCMEVTSTRSWSGGRSALVELQQGALRVHSSGADGGEVAVISDAGMTTGTSGGFRVALEPEATRTEATAGEVSVIGGGTEVSLQVGEGSRVRAGQAPEPPTRLPDAGQPLTPLHGVVLYRPAFSWSPAPGALGYQLEISTDPNFTDLLLTQNLPTTDWNPSALFLPFRVDGLWWRLSSFDRTGFQGIPSEGRVLQLPPGVGP